ncbi:MAG: nitrile hydratase beta subunit [Hyphomicrobiaceae bacterium]|jgi:nitrile hydratase beta subunit
MDGIHDLAGIAGFGSVAIEPDEPVFHETWEARAFAMNVLGIAVLASYNTDEYRHAIERMTPAHYLAARYYERVLTGAATLFVEKGLLAHADLAARAGGAFPLAQPEQAARPAQANEETETSSTAGPRFEAGEIVAVRNVSTSGHTRVPRYCRGHQGRVLHVAPAFTFPDLNAHGRPSRQEPTYHVEFAASDLWPDAGDCGETVVVDLWETYLEKAS